MLNGRDDMVMGAACAVVAIMRLARAVSTRFVLVCMDVLYFEFAPSCDRSRLGCSFDPSTNKEVRNEQPKIRPHGCDTDREPIMIALLLAEVSSDCCETFERKKCSSNNARNHDNISSCKRIRF
jgi:hypothetical protein